MNDIIKDVSTLSTINDKYLNKLIELCEYSIIDSIIEDDKVGKDICEVNIGIGTLYIKIQEDNLKMKFLPSDDFRKKIANSLKDGKSSLETTLESNLAERITNVYKGFI